MVTLAIGVIVCSQSIVQNMDVKCTFYLLFVKCCHTVI